MKTVVVTGASAGVGRATAEAFGARGDRVALIARGRTGSEAAAREVRARRRHRARAAVRRRRRRCGRGGCGASSTSSARSTCGSTARWPPCSRSSTRPTPPTFRRVTEVTYLGCVHGTLAALRRMRPRDRGVIVQVGSALAYRAIPLQATYCAAKFAIRGFTDSLRTELLHEGSGVRVTMVQLPGLNTTQFTWVRTTLRRHPRPVAAGLPARGRRRRDRARRRAPAPRALGRGEHPDPHRRQQARARARRSLPRAHERRGAADARADRPRPPGLPLRPLGDRGSHGPFDGEARGSSVQLALAKRRRALSIAAAATAATAVGATFARRSAPMRLTVLGSGSPRPDPLRSQPAALLAIGGEPVLVDCGDGTMRRLVEAGVDAASVTRVVLHPPALGPRPGPARVRVGLVGSRPPAARAVGTGRHRRPAAHHAAGAVRRAGRLGGEAGVGSRGVGRRRRPRDRRRRDGRRRGRPPDVRPRPPPADRGVRRARRARRRRRDDLGRHDRVRRARRARTRCGPAAHGRLRPRARPSPRRLPRHAGRRRDRCGRRGVARLVLTHLLPETDPRHVAAEAGGRFAGVVGAADDLDTYDVP